MIKLNITIDETKWLEANWYDETITINKVPKEVDVETVEVEEEAITKLQVHCESFSGHQEHIKMLRDKAKEFVTDLKEFEGLIKEAEDAYTPPTQGELDAIAKEQKIAEAKSYLASTDFKMTVDYYARLTAEEQAELTAKRAEARAFLKENGL